MRTVLGRTAGRATLILVFAGMVGSAATPVVPAFAASHHPVRHAVHGHAVPVRIGTAVAYVREPDGTIRRIR